MAEEKASEVDMFDMMSQRQARNRNGKCYRACLLRECNIMDVYGRFSPKTSFELSEMMSTGNASQLKRIFEVVRKCLQKLPIGRDRCQNAENLFVCFEEDGKLADDTALKVAHTLHGGDENKVPMIESVISNCLKDLDHKEDRCEYTEKMSRCVIEHCAECGLKVFNLYD
uniref:Uncharacterized protein n=1 Tax=Stomoxys calcitrans TaxID=35570 RepID=A0A1I8P3M9_STOCA